MNAEDIRKLADLHHSGQWHSPEIPEVLRACADVVLESQYIRSLLREATFPPRGDGYHANLDNYEARGKLMRSFDSALAKLEAIAP